MLKSRIICTAIAISILFSACGSTTSTFMTDDADYSPVTKADKANNFTQGAAVQEYDDDAYDNTTAFDATINTLTGLPADEPSPNNETVMTATTPQAGILTAGEWSDNENWGFFTNLINTDRLTYPLFGLDPTQRIAVNVSDKNGKAAINLPVSLVSGKGDVIWQGVTDYKGRVYLMNAEYCNDVYVVAGKDGKKHKVDLKASKSDSKQGTDSVSSTELEITAEGDVNTKNSKNADIMFIIDSTGSMHDEMDFLQSEFTEITNRTSKEGTRYSVNFYRDEGDDYLTKCSDFSSDVKEVQDRLNHESAGGGKGQIAAVSQALDESINNSSWSDDSVKLAFLIFDAPPYKESADSLAKSVETAAKMGIRLIPVVGSGSDSDVEMFGRAIAIETGGKYVFLTDDSGVGESHEEPIIGPHEVRPLVDIVTDIINEYRG